MMRTQPSRASSPHPASSPHAPRRTPQPANDHIGPTAKPNYQWMPLHVGAMAGAPVGTMKMVLEAYPEAASKVDTLDGSLPLHMCISRETDEAVLELLINAYPKGAQTLAANKELPLHKAIAKATPSVVRRLLDAFPRGASRRATPGGPTAGAQPLRPRPCRREGTDLSAGQHDATRDGIRSAEVHQSW